MTSERCGEWAAESAGMRLGQRGGGPGGPRGSGPEVLLRTARGSEAAARRWSLHSLCVRAQPLPSNLLWTFRRGGRI